MAYASADDVQAHIANIDITSTTKVSTDELTKLLTQTNSEIDAALASQGLTTPVTTPDEFVNELAQLNARGSAALALLALYPAEAGPGSSGQAAQLWRAYLNRLKELRQGIGIPSGAVSADTTGTIRTFFGDQNAIGEGVDSTLTDQWGEKVDSAPKFTMGRKF